MTTQNTLQTIISYLPVAAGMLLIASIPFYYGPLQRIALYAMAITYPLDYVVNRRWRNWHWDKRYWVYVALLALFLMTPIRQLFDPTPPTPFFWRQFMLRVAFGVMGLAGLLGFSDRLRLHYVGYTMLAVSVGIFGYVLFLTGTHPNELYGDFLEQFNEWRRLRINSHMALNLYMNVALIFGFYILNSPSRRWIKILTAVAMALIFTCLMFSQGRTGFITALGILFVLGIYTISRYNKRLILPTCLLIFALSAVVVYFNQRLTREKFEGEPRWEIWDFSMSMVRERPLAGYGLSTLSCKYVENMYADEVMNRRYIHGILDNPPFDTAPRTMECIHPHNVFLELQLENGLVGPLLYLLLFVLTAILCQRHRIYVWTSLLAILTQSMFEPLGPHLLPMFIAVTIFVWTFCDRQDVETIKIH